MEKVVFKTAFSKGIGIGEVKFYKRNEHVVSKIKIKSSEINREINKYLKAKEKTQKQLERLITNSVSELKDQKEIFLTHISIVNDTEINEKIEKLIRENLVSAEYAIKKVFSDFAKLFKSLDNEILKTKVLDLNDVKNRILRIIKSSIELSINELKEDTIIVADELYPSELISILSPHLKGVILSKGGSLSHTAILIKSYSIPGLILNTISDLKDANIAIIDGNNSKLIINPNQKTLIAYNIKKSEYQNEISKLKEFELTFPRTKDGTEIKVLSNIDNIDIDNNIVNISEGVGLFRSEFLYLNNEYEDEEKQFQAYKRLIEIFKGKEVTIRTLDIGGDKITNNGFPKEENPFLGKRSIRICLSNKKLFITQLKALLRASFFGDLKIMIPFISTIEDIKETQKIITDIKEEFQANNISFGNYKFGVMIEVPSTLFILDEIVDIVDFGSIGTNDLCQYLFAVDRNNETVSNYYQSLSPVMFRAIKKILEAFSKKGKELSICGELGGDSRAIKVLLGLGIKRISVSAKNIAIVKKTILNSDLKELEPLVNKVLNATSEKSVMELLE